MTVDWTKPIETTEGFPARVISDNYRSARYSGCVLRVVQVDFKEFSVVWYVDNDDSNPAHGGKLIRNRKTKREGWVNLYRSPEGDIQSGMRTWTSEGAAKEAAAHRKDHIVTTKFEWEE